MDGKARFGIVFDFRNPSQWLQPWQKFYEATIEFAAWTETLGFGDIWMSEHHGVEDGYLPSPLPVAAAISAKTKRAHIGTSVALAPFYNPVRLAEDAAVIDNISGGRLELGFGLGYLENEFAGYGLPIKERGRMTNEIFEIARRLWDGETVTFNGNYFKIENTRIMPKPARPRLPLWVGGFNRNALKRAVQFGDGYIGSGADIGMWHKMYVDELAAVGRPPEDARMICGAWWLIVSEDPEKTWAEVGPHYHYQISSYAKWLAGTTHELFEPVDLAGFKESGQLLVLTPEEAITYFKEQITNAPSVERFCGMVPPAGYPLEKYASHVELFANKVIPAFR